ncbi:class I SAM-dependent methyltransferase [Streptomyces naphthomycinicus]|uniref:class I SAM-dependent methyltransferase n=1 Tax=Streptomyces naphthomycinicus TaxID=2872625 RepID=UPI001CECD353|nr:class I SAM-dependent methyltransferase [Streptomyces sp. TML10]
MTGYHALIKGSSVTVFGPDGTEIASGSRKGDVAVGRVGDARLVSDGYGDRRLSSFAMLAARHHRAATDPSARDKVWVRWEEDGVAAVYGTDKYDDDDVRALKAGNLYWSGQRQARVTGRKWNPETRDRNLAAALQAFARQDRNIVVLGPGQTPKDLVTSPTAAAAVPAQQTPPAAAAPAPPPEPEPEPLDLTGLSYEELLEAEGAAAVERSRDHSAAAERRYQALRKGHEKWLLDRVEAAPAVTELSSEELAAEYELWQKALYKSPFHSSDEEYRTLERRNQSVRTEQYARIARTILAGPAAADLDDEALESTHEQIGRTWTRLPSERELHDQVTGYRKAVQEERIARRARSYGERTPVGEMTLEDLIAESDELGSSLNATNEQSSYSYSEAVKEARAARLKAVEAECFQRGLEQNPDAARARLGSNLGGRRTVLIDGSDRGYGYVERQGRKFRALTSFDQRSNIGDFDSAPAAMAALVRRYDHAPETLPRRTWGLEREVDLPVSAHDPLVSWLRRRPSKLSREYDRVLDILTPYQLPTRTKVANPLTSQVMQAHPFYFEEGLLGELARIAERTTEDLRQQSLDDNLPKREREAAKRRIPTMGAALIGINAVIEQVRAAGGDVDRRGVDQSRLAAQMAALVGTVNEQEGGEADGDDEPVRDAAAQALGGVPAAGTGGDAGPGPVLPQAGGADERGDRRGGGGPGGEPGAGDGLPGSGRTAGSDQGNGAGAGAARDAAAAGGRGQPGGAAESGGDGAGGDPQGAGEPVARFRPDPADLPRGPMARAEANLEAVKVLRTLESARRGATTEEKRVLARWSGWGSVPTVFLDEPDPDEPIYAPGGEWEGRFEADHARWESYDRVRGELRELLDPFEWRAASRAVLSAHYTPQGVAEAMWQGLAAYGFAGGEVLEAGCGSGAFFGVAPENARLTGVEVDPTTAAIAARIYPHANVLSESFTDTDAPVGTFDLVVGNVPFAQAPFGERRYGATGHSLHNGFIIKQLALLRPGGYMAVITSRWTLDGEDASARRAMSRWGDLAAAYRLPAGTFGETADTDVVADVLVFRRRAEGEEPGGQTWIDAPERELGGNTLAVNAYFTQHPENLLGRLTSEAGPYGPRVTVQGDPGEAPRLLRERMEASAAAAVADGQGSSRTRTGPTARRCCCRRPARSTRRTSPAASTSMTTGRSGSTSTARTQSGSSPPTVPVAPSSCGCCCRCVTPRASCKSWTAPAATPTVRARSAASSPGCAPPTPRRTGRCPGPGRPGWRCRPTRPGPSPAPPASTWSTTNASPRAGAGSARIRTPPSCWAWSTGTGRTTGRCPPRSSPGGRAPAAAIWSPPTTRRRR